MAAQKSLRSYFRGRWARFKRLRKRNIPRDAATGVLTTGIIAAFGILSVGGAILINPALGVLVAAFVFGGMAEGEVFFEEIKEGLKDILLVGRRGQRLLVSRYLKRQLKKTPPASGSFLEDYEKTRKYLKKIKGKDLTPQQINDRQFALARFKIMQDYLVDRVINNTAMDDSETAFDSDIISSLQTQKKKIKIKMWLMRLSLPLSVMLGGAFTFAMAGVFPTGLAALGIVAMSAVVWPMAIVAGLGFVYLMIHTAKEILFSDWFDEWKTRIRDWMKGELTPRHVLKVALTVLGLLLVTGLCIAAIILNTATFWLYMQQGVSLVTQLTNTVKWVANAATILFNAGQFLFSLFKSIESVHSIATWFENNKLLDVLHEKTIGFFKALRKDENLFQCLDPFRFIARSVQKLTNMVMLLGHVTASGMGGDRTSFMSAQAASGINAGNEFTQDLPFFNKADNEKTLIERIVTLALSPILILSGVWQTLGSRFNTDKPKLRLGEAMMNAFELEAPEKITEKVPEVSDHWQNKEINVFFEREKQRLGKTHIGNGQAKIAVLNNARDTLRTGEGVQQAESNYSVLNQNRLFQAKKPTRSAQFLTEMKHRYAPQAATR